MNTKGIRISDGSDDVLSVSLFDILEEISNGKSFYWSILFLDGTPNQGQGAFLSEYETKINDSENGLNIDWEELLTLSNKFYQMFETTILGCKDVKLLKRYDSDEEMYKACDITIELIDCVFWEVYSKDELLIDRLDKKFEKTEFLEPNFENSPHL